MKKMVKLSVVAAVAMTSSAFAASDLAGAFKEGTTSGYVRAMYVGDNYKAPNDDKSTLGVGGKLGFVTGSLGGFKGGVSFFTVNDLGTRSSDVNKIDGFMFDTTNGSTPYTLVGEAYIQYDMGKTTVKVGRQQLDTPLAGSDDIRIIPNMFTAYTVINTDIANTTLVASHVTQMAGLDAYSSYSQFKSMADQVYAYSPTLGWTNVSGITGNQAVSVAGVVNSSLADTTIQVWEYYGHEMLNAIYGDATYAPKLTPDLTLTAAGQAYTVAGMGKLKTALGDIGEKVDYSVFGAKIALASESSGFTGTLAYNKVGGNDKTVTIFGSFGGYPEYALADEFWMNSQAGLAKSTVYKGSVDLNLGAYGLGERVVSVSQSKFNLNDEIAQMAESSDVSVTNLVYACKPTKDLAVRAVYEMRDYKDNDLDNTRVKVSATYSF